MQLLPKNKNLLTLFLHELSIKLVCIFPISGENIGWEITAKVVRVDKEKNFMAFEFIEDDDFKKFSLAFYDEMRKKGLM